MFLSFLDRSSGARRALRPRPFWRSAIVSLLVGFGLGCREKPTAGAANVRVIGTQGTGPGQFIEPRALATSADGKLFVIDKTSRVQRFSASGDFEHFWHMPGENRKKGAPSGIHVDKSSRVLVADTHESQVVVFDQDGRVLLRFGERGTGPGHFMLPTDVAVDSQCLIYVSEAGGNDRISKFSAHGEFLFAFGDLLAGSASLQHPAGLAVDEDDRIWVSDSNNHRICCFSPTGGMLASFGTLGSREGELRYPRDVVLLGTSTIAVVDQHNNRIEVFEQTGRFVKRWGHPGRDPEGMHLPENIAYTLGSLIIADAKNHRVLALAMRPQDSAAMALSMRAPNSWGQ